MMAAQLGAEVELGDDAVAIHGHFPLQPRDTDIDPGRVWIGDCACLGCWPLCTTRL